MASFPGGSPWAMVRDIGAGFYALNARSFTRFQRPDLDKLGHELERALRDVRSEQAPLDDMKAIQARNRRIQRLTSAMTMLRAYRMKAKK